MANNCNKNIGSPLLNLAQEPIKLSRHYFVKLAVVSVLALTKVDMAFALGAAVDGPDAGALNQGLEKQLPLVSPLELPEPKRPDVPEISNDIDGKATLTIKVFLVEGATLINNEAIQEVIAPWLNKLITINDLKKTTDAIEELYRSKGYLVQATVPPQKIFEGNLRITLTEAKLGEAKVNEVEGETRFGKQRAIDYLLYANPIGIALNIDKVRNAVTLLNEIPGVAATSSLEAGSKPGLTNVNLALYNTPLLTGKVEANNYGSLTTGSEQGVFQSHLNNPLGYGDKVSLSGIFSEGSRYVQSGYNFALLPNGLRGGVSGTYLNYENIGTFKNNGGTGYAYILGASLAYPLLRAPKTNLNVGLNYDNKTYQNQNIATNTIISDYRINNVTLSLSGNHFDGFLAGGTSNAAVNFIYGNLDVFSDTPANYMHYQSGNQSISYAVRNYFKLYTSLSRNQVLIPDSTNLIFNLSGQIASGNLNSAEQFYLGGSTGIKAYPVAQGNGSNGAMGTLELKQALPYHFTGSSFVGAGAVQQYVNTFTNWQGKTNAPNTYAIADTGLGLNFKYKGFNIDSSVAWTIGNNPLYNATGQALNIDSTTWNPRFWLSGSYTL
jgi:hemolysin activation/secretion protein